MKVDPVVVNAYASALLEAVKGRKELDRAAAEAAVVTDIFHANPRLRIFLESPNIPDAEKTTLIDKVFGSQFMDLIVRFLHLMLRRRRLDHISASLDRFRALVVAEQGKHEATFTTAVELGTEQRRQLEAAMEKVTGWTLHATYHVDPAVMGGVLFRSEDILIDTTLRSGLHEIRSRLMRAQVLA